MLFLVEILFKLLIIYLGETKVLQYFCNLRHNSAAAYAFVEVVKVMNHTVKC